MAKTKKVKFEEYDKGRVFICQLRAVEVSQTRGELVEIYKASHKVFGYTLPLFSIVSAIRERIGHFQVEEI